MMNTKKFFAAIIAAMLLINLVPAVTFAANTPYCRIAYDASYACNTVKYYSYSGNAYQNDFSRLVKFFSGKITVGTENTQVTAKHDTASNPSWTADGKYLVWLETDAVAYARAYNGSSNLKVTEKVSAINLNSDSMADSVTFSDNSTKKLSELLPGASTVTTNSSTEKSENSSNTSTNTNTNNNRTSNVKVSETVNTAGQTVVTVGNNKVTIDGNTVYANNIRISEICESGVRYIGVTSSTVYLYEDSTKSYYRFSFNNLFNPEKIKLNATLLSVETDKNGQLTAIKTSNGTFKLSQLVVDKEWLPSKTYAINKVDYVQFYLADTNTKYTLSVKDKTVYLNGKKVTAGLTKSIGVIGAQKDYLVVLKGTKVYRSSWKKPTKLTLWKQNVASLVKSEKNGLVTSVKRLSEKKDYVKVSKSRKKAVLYQSGKKYKTLKIVKKGTKITLNGKTIAKLSKKQKKKGIKFKAVGFTEDGYIFYTTGKSYRASISKPKKAKLWKNNLKHYLFDNTLGFVSKVK